MSDFMLIKEAVQKRFEDVFKEQQVLFEVEVDKDELWNLYLDSFPEGTNEIFRTNREHDCSCCRHFIKRIGNVVAIKNGKIETLWDFDCGDNEFTIVAKAMHDYISSKAITSVFYTYENKCGTDRNPERLEDGRVLNWEHFYLDLPNQFVKGKDDIGTLRGKYNSTVDVFRRALNELTLESFNVVMELIDNGLLPRGNEFKQKVNKFLKLKKKYDKLSDGEKIGFEWFAPSTVGLDVTHIRNSAIGTLLIDISEGLDLDNAVRKYEIVVAGENYKRPKPIYTKAQLERAKQTIQELGYMDSLERRFAKLDDITVNNIMFCNRDIVNVKQGGVLDIFDEMAKATKKSPKKYSNVREIGIKEFVENVLPHAQSVEAMIENKHMNNMVSLIAPVNKNAKSMLKWDNNFGWVYKGNIADSSMKDRVKKAGGKVDGVLRFSIQWNDRDTFDNVDLDAHCRQPNGETIMFSNSKSRFTDGNLDVDITHCSEKQIPVENITFPNLNKMLDGKYLFRVHNYSSGRGAKSGFRAEIAFGEEIFEFDYAQATRGKQYVDVAEVTLKNGEFTIKELLPSTTSSREIWGVNTNEFVPVSVIMNSPNYWDEQNGVGNEHYFFMLQDCVNDESPNGFFNEFLKGELHDHRKFFEALGSKMRVQDTDEQLSGVGFNTYKRSDLLVKVKGSMESVMRIKF